MPLTEDDLIARYFAPLAGPAGQGLQDDVARLTPPPGRELVVTVDTLVAGVHFFPDDPPALIAAKALRVNLSDLAAKGALPLGFLLSLALPQGVGEPWLEAFARGLGADAEGFACPLIGGDTVRTPGPLTLSVTALGTVAPGALPTRMGAQPGDALMVTGTIGDSALGLQIRLGKAPALSQSARAHLLARYLKPEPRLGLAMHRAHAAMDISDGLVGDLAKMLKASGLGGVLDLRQAPFSPAAREYLALAPDALELAVTGGDDYEVLAAVPEAQAFPALTLIGRVTPAPGLVVLGLDGQPQRYARGAYSHF